MADQEPIKFWLKDRSVTGLVVARSPEEGILVDYRGKLSVVKDDAVVKVGAAVQFTRNTLPIGMKRAFALVPEKARKATRKTDVSQQIPASEPEELQATKGEVEMKKGLEVKPGAEQPAATPVKPSAEEKAPKRQKVKRSPLLQMNDSCQVECVCACCKAVKVISVRPTSGGSKFEITQGKVVSEVNNPFFIMCDVCKGEIAVKLIPVTTYIAQTAGFKG